MPVDGTTIESQIGASAGLWTHTPVDWRGNETGVAPPGPAGWPANAAVAEPPAGSTGAASGTEPLITAISASAILATTATINWTVQPASSSVVQYGTTTAYGSTSTADVGAGARTKGLTGLTTATLYNYRIVSTIVATGAVTYSTNRTFTTA
jgi:hypothetical protein